MTDVSVPFTTNDAGIPAASDEHSLTAGPDGPILLQDHYLIQKMAQFNRERVPERVVHAKGGGAFGLLRGDRGRQRSSPRPTCSSQGQADRRCWSASPPSPASRATPTPSATRAASRSSSTPSEGNYDLVGNNTPVFFIRDPSEVPGLHPLAEAPRRQPPARQQHAVGLLDALARVGAPGDLPDGRPGHPADLAPHERLRQPHLHVGQRRRREVLGQVPLQDRPGHRVLHRRRGRRPSPARTPTTTSATSATPSSAATTRPGRCRCRSCRSRTRRTTASTRST